MIGKHVHAFPVSIQLSAQYADRVPGVLVRDSLCRPSLVDSGALSVILEKALPLSLQQ